MRLSPEAQGKMSRKWKDCTDQGRGENEVGC